MLLLFTLVPAALMWVGPAAAFAVVGADATAVPVPDRLAELGDTETAEFVEAALVLIAAALEAPLPLAATDAFTGDETVVLTRVVEALALICAVPPGACCAPMETDTVVARDVPLPATLACVAPVVTPVFAGAWIVTVEDPAARVLPVARNSPSSEPVARPTSHEIARMDSFTLRFIVSSWWPWSDHPCVGSGIPAGDELHARPRMASTRRNGNRERNGRGSERAAKAHEAPRNHEGSYQEQEDRAHGARPC
jgi:hypothetical protein